MGLLDFLFRKQRYVEEMMRRYLDAWEECIDRFKRGIDVYVEEGFSERFFDLVDKTHESESRADDQRRDVEYELYGKALLPESRGDLLGLLEQLDRIPNRAEVVLFMIATDRIELPRPLRPGFQRFVNVTDEAIRLLLQMARGVFRSDLRLAPIVREVDDRESRCDRIKRELLREIASAGVESFRKVTLRDLMVQVGELSDLTESIADRMMILRMKRRV
jgi:hypothetical protein